MKSRIIVLFFVFQCSSIYSIEFNNKERAKFRNIIVQATNSHDISTILTGILIGEHFESRDVDALYDRGLKLHSPYYLWLDQNIKQCLFSKDFRNCDLKSDIQYLIHQRPGNALPYIYRALLNEKKNHLQDSLNDLQMAIGARDFDDFYWRRFELLSKKFKDHHFPENSLQPAAVNLSFNLVSQTYIQLRTLCKKQSSLNLKWKNTCIEIGKVLVKKGNIFLANMVGYAIQREAFSHTPKDQKKLTIIKSDREKLNQWRIHAVKTLDFITGQKKGPSSYYRDLIELGELQAVKNALKVHAENSSLENH